MEKLSQQINFLRAHAVKKAKKIHLKPALLLLIKKNYGIPNLLYRAAAHTIQLE